MVKEKLKRQRTLNIQELLNLLEETKLGKKPVEDFLAELARSSLFLSQEDVEILTKKINEITLSTAR